MYTEEETMLMSDALFSREALSELNTVKERPARRNKVKGFLTVSDEKTAADDKNDKKPPHCPLCNSSHDLDECRNFNEMEVEGRSKFLSKQKLCYLCYQNILQSHTARNCPIRRTCKICAGKHPTGLHGFKLKRKGDYSFDDNNASEIVKSNCANISNTQCAAIGSGQVISMCVVPVKVQHKESNKEIITFAMLDTCSQGTFATENLMNQLDINGIRTSIGIRTLIGHQKQSSYLLDGLSVSKLVLGPSEKAKWIRLPSTFTRKEIPVDQSEIATPAKLKQWKHLDRISGKIRGNESITVESLIGSHCLKASEPLEVLRSQENGPYAIRTALGWCVIGPIGMKDGKTISCNRIAVTEASSGGTARHHFAIEDKYKEVGIHEMLMKLYIQDFVEPKTTKDEVCDALQDVYQDDE